VGQNKWHVISKKNRKRRHEIVYSRRIRIILIRSQDEIELSKRPPPYVMFTTWP